MYGASGKMGRGGGGGSGGKRNIHAPPIGRPTPAGRLSMGGGPRGRGGPSSAAASSPSTSSLQVEESFSLIRENPLNFGMAIKLAPDLVEEIKRVEAQGGTARIKFGANATGNVIHVGDKTFKFTWSREPGDLCDVYEECRSGDGGNGLLVESGGTWRKLNVERELDESTKNHVKRRSEEAERKTKSRKAIVLEHQNPSMKNQMKAFAASESNQWRNFKNRKEPPSKKPKFEPTSAGGPTKSGHKTGLPITNASKGRLSTGSPLSSQPEQPGPSTSPVGIGDIVKGHTVVSDFAASQSLNKVLSSEKDIANKRNSTISEKSKYNRNVEANPTDLKNLIRSLLLEHQSTGMSLKALEKATGDAMPNSARIIEPILKQIAYYQAPGRYFLKPATEMESFKKLPQSGSSPENNRDQSPAQQKFDQPPAQDPVIQMRTAVNNEEQGDLNTTPTLTTDIIEKIDIMNSPENLSDKNVSNNSEGAAAGSSSDSGSDSDSDSDSSDSDSGSPSKSKSRSPVGSRSGSSSDSDTDASSSSKQASDEDVDIMTSDDEKESKHKLQDPDPTASRNPVQWSNLDNESVDIGNSEIQDHISDVIEVDIEKDSPEFERGAEMHAANNLFAKEGEELTEEIKPSSPDHHEQQERQVTERKGYDESNSMVNDGFKQSQSGNQGRSSKSNSKRRFDDKNSDGRAHSKKRPKSKNSIEPVSGTINSLFGESPCNSSPDRPSQVPDKMSVDLMEDRTTRNDTDYPDLQTGPHQAISYRPVSDSQQPAQRSSEARGWAEAPSGEKRPGKHNSLDHGVKYSDRSLQSIEGPQVQKGVNTDVQCEDGLVNERWQQPKFTTERVGDKHPSIMEPHIRKSDKAGKVKETGSTSNSYWGYSPKDKNPSTVDRSPMVNGRNGVVLRREHSDLELGEFREPFNDETPVAKKQFEKKNSFKNLENKQMDAEYWNSDLSGGKTSNKIPAVLGKPSPPNSDAAISINPDGSYRRKGHENYVDDLTRPHHRSNRPMDAHHQPRGDLNSQQITVPEVSGKTRFAEAGMVRSASVEAYGDASRKIPANSTEQQHDPIPGVGVKPRVPKQSKKLKPNRTGISNDGRIDALTGSNDIHQKKTLPSSDEASCSFTKFEKEEPELKGPVRDISQYKEYVKEYQEKYESYCSLNKILESYRDEFSKLGKDLDAYKGRDMKKYNDILEQMRSSFRQCGEKHKRLKKIFVVLYEELKHLKQMIKDYATSCKKD